MRKIMTFVLMMLIGGYGAAFGQASSTGAASNTGGQSPQVGTAMEEATKTEEATKDFLGLKWGLGIGVIGSFGGEDVIEKASIVDGVVRVEEEGDMRPQVFMEMHVLLGGKAKKWRNYQRWKSSYQIAQARTMQSAEVDPETAERRNSEAQPAKDQEGRIDQGREGLSTSSQSQNDQASGKQGGRQRYVPYAPDPPLMGVGPFIALQGSEDDVIDSLAVGVMWGFRKDPEKENSVNIGIGVSFDPSVQVLAGGMKDGQATTEEAVRFKKEGRFGWALMASFTF